MATRKRTERRTQDRDAQKVVLARAKLASLELGGSPARPQIVQSASVIEPHAESQSCYACGGSVRVMEHRAEAGLRIVSVRCKNCGRARDVFFELVARTLN
jgi:hypothetical protein